MALSGMLQNTGRCCSKPARSMKQHRRQEKATQYLLLALISHKHSAARALSVSISASTSPGAIASPSFFFQDEMLPWVMVGDRDGMPSSVWLANMRSRLKP